MIQISANNLVQINRLLLIATLTIEKDASEAGESPFPKECAAVLEPLLKKLLASCQELGLVMTMRQLERLLESIRSKKNVNLVRRWMETLGLRLTDELQDKLFFYIPSKAAKRYLDEKPFGEAVAEKFPDLTEEIAEASKCLALDRFTACVFHLMRTLDPLVRRFCQQLGAKEVNSWGPMLTNIQAEIDLLRPDDERRRAYHEAAIHLRNVKDAWRNPTMHEVKQAYTEEEADRVFNNVKDFVCCLVDIL
jgi:hypothetical protein